MPVLIVKNLSREGPGLLEGVLAKYKIEFDMVDISRGDKLPDPLRYDALFVFGGPSSANDKTFAITDELAQIKKAIDAQVPYLGICLGMQLLAKAGGGSVVKAEKSEIGWRDPDGNPFSIDLTADGFNDPLFLGFHETIQPIFHLHGEAAKLNGSMRLLATGKFCEVQAVRVGDNAYGLQGHLELDEQTFKSWLDQDADLMQIPRQQLEDGYRKAKGEYERNGTLILTNFLKVARLIK